MIDFKNKTNKTYFLFGNTFVIFITIRFVKQLNVVHITI